jgi:hypothetical protein
LAANKAKMVKIPPVTSGVAVFVIVVILVSLASAMPSGGFSPFLQKNSLLSLFFPLFSPPTRQFPPYFAISLPNFCPITRQCLPQIVQTLPHTAQCLYWTAWRGTPRRGNPS